MDLQITIRDENSDVIAEETIYQDGSDSDGALAIVEYLKENFKVEDNV